MKPLDGKVAIITGASRGIGRAIALALAGRGARCVLCARNETRLRAVVHEIGTSHGDAVSLPLDLRDPDAAARLVTFCLDQYTGLDIVINNAGATRRGEFLTLTDADFLDGFALKYFGAVRVIRAAWPHLRTTKGSIVNIAGVGGRTPGALFSIGGSVNAALLSLTKSLAAAGITEGIQVNAVNPGSIRTDRLLKRLSDLAAEQDIDLQAAERRFIAAEQLTRVGEPEDIAGLIAFVVSPEGRFLQGALIDMDGGATRTI